MTGSYVLHRRNSAQKTFRRPSTSPDLGLLIKKKKLQLSPSQVILYFGGEDRLNFWVFLSPKRVQLCLQTVRNFLSLKSCSTNSWMSPLGTLTSIEKFISLGRLHIKVLQLFLRSFYRNCLWLYMSMHPTSCQYGIQLCNYLVSYIFKNDIFIIK